MKYLADTEWAKAILTPIMLTPVRQILKVRIDLHFPKPSTLTHNPFIPISVTLGQLRASKTLKI